MRESRPVVGLVLVSHGPLAGALRETVNVLQAGELPPLEAVSLDWDESPEKASSRLEKAIAAADSGLGVVVLTDMFGGTPSNLALAFLEKGRVEIVSGVNLPMVVKGCVLAREGKGAHDIARALVEKGRRAIHAASEALDAERGTGTAGGPQ